MHRTRHGCHRLGRGQAAADAASGSVQHVGAVVACRPSVVGMNREPSAAFVVAIGIACIAVVAACALVAHAV